MPRTRALKFKDRPLNWGGTTQLATRESKFETNEQGDAAPAASPQPALRRRHEQRRKRCALRCHDEYLRPTLRTMSPRSAVRSSPIGRGLG